MLKDKDEKPANFHDGMDKVEYFNMVAYAIVDEYILKFKSPSDILEPVQELPQPLVEHGYYQSPVPCGYHACTLTFTNPDVRLRHRSTCKMKPLGEATNTTKKTSKMPAPKQDFKFNYITHVLRKGILDILRHDATREGNGTMLWVLWKNDFLIMKSAKHKNYSILAFIFTAQKECLLNEREVHQLLHNRCVNLHGGKGGNVSGDLAMEFLNKEVKPHLQHKITNLTSKVFERAGRSIKVCQDVVDIFDKQIELYTSIGKHEENHYLKEVDQMVKDLISEELFKYVPGRFFTSFPQFERFPEYQLEGAKLRMWLANQKLKIHDYDLNVAVAPGHGT